MRHLSGLSFSCLAVAGIAVAAVVAVAVEEHLSFPVKQTCCYLSSSRELGLVG